MHYTLKISKWKYNVKSPVVFMIDDIANIYIKNSDLLNLQVGEDWGHFGTSENSMWDFLNKNLYSLFPYIKTTFFLVTDKRAPETLGTKYTYAEAIDKDESFMSFLNMLSKDDKIEIAYHGTTHGYPTNVSFQHEWDTYESLDQAIETIEGGKTLFKKVLGNYPEGGKYCGYIKGEYGDISINKTNFFWWCREWSDDLLKNDDSNFELKYFGSTIDIPSTVDGSNLSLKIPQMSRKYFVSIYNWFFKKNTLEKRILSLYKKRQIISIQEHSSPYRTDGRIQYPNIIMDIENLKYIFSLLSKLDIWYVTGIEIATYFYLYTNIEIHRTTDSFVFSFKNNVHVQEGSIITLIFEEVDSNNQIELFMKGKRYISYDKNGVKLIDIPVYRDIPL